MKLKTSQSSHKLRGGYYTPSIITQFIVEWISQHKEVHRILEPSAGDGQFIKSLVDTGKDYDITGIELIDEEAKKISEIKSGNAKLKVMNCDFYEYYEHRKGENNKKFDAIIGNPPYIRYQYLTSRQREFQSDILKSNNLKPNKLINAWVAFTVASLELLKEGGKFAFVLPSDILQVSYAKQLREFLLNTLSNITIITFEELAFKGIQQDVILLLGTKSTLSQAVNSGERLKILNLKNLMHLKKNILDKPFNMEKTYDIDKWTRFYLDDNERDYYDKVYRNKMIKFNSCAKVEVGITTGNNNFFVINDQTKNNFKLFDYVVPILGRSVETYGNIYDDDDLHRNKLENKKIWLLDFNNKDINEHAKYYLEMGVNNKENIGYKLSLRKRWFDVPSIWIPDAFMLRRIGKIPKFILNGNNSTSTDTFHRVKFSNPNKAKIVSFFFYSSATLLSLELEGRVFGGGALEILPGDMKNVQIPKISSALTSEKLEVLNEELNLKIRRNEDWHEIIKWVDKYVVKYSDFNTEEMKEIFKMWEKINLKRTKCN